MQNRIFSGHNVVRGLDRMFDDIVNGAVCKDIELILSQEKNEDNLTVTMSYIDQINNLMKDYLMELAQGKITKETVIEKNRVMNHIKFQLEKYALNGYMDYVYKNAAEIVALPVDLIAPSKDKVELVRMYREAVNNATSVALGMLHSMEKYGSVNNIKKKDILSDDEFKFLDTMRKKLDSYRF